MRWNNVGLLGGRAIVEMLQTNKILTRIELAGNNIPADILKAIGKLVTTEPLYDCAASRESLFWDFQPSRTQTGLYSHRSWLEA